jgi:hypothetical protein
MENVPTSFVWSPRKSTYRASRELGIPQKTVWWVPPLLVTLVDLHMHITTAITVIDHDMLQRVWQELDYQLDVCRVTGGAHFEHS